MPHVRTNDKRYQLRYRNRVNAVRFDRDVGRFRKVFVLKKGDELVVCDAFNIAKMWQQVNGGVIKSYELYDSNWFNRAFAE